MWAVNWEKKRKSVRKCQDGTEQAGFGKRILYPGATFFAEFAFVAAHALAFSTDTVAVPTAVGHLALVVAQRALLALPARVTDALSVGVLAMLGAQYGAHALAAVVAPEAGVALAVTQQALTVAGAAVGTVLGHVLGYGRVEGQLLHVPVVVVKRDEPVPRLHIACHLPSYRQLFKIRPCERSGE